MLLNHLTIDSQGRIVFDSSDDATDIAHDRQASRDKGDDSRGEEELEADPYADSIVEEPVSDDEDVEIDISALGSKFFPDLDILDAQDVCPSLKSFDIGDPSAASQIPFLKAPDDWRQDREKSEGSEHDAPARRYDQTGIFIDEDNPMGFDDDDRLLDNFAIPDDAAFGEGGEAWARDAAIESRGRVHLVDADNDAADGEERAGSFDPEAGEYMVTLEKGHKQGGYDDVLSYFDEKKKKNRCCCLFQWE